MVYGASPVNFSVGTVERTISDRIYSRYCHVLAPTLLRQIIEDILSQPEVNIRELKEKLTESEINEEAIIEAIKSFKNEAETIHRHLDKQAYDLAETIRDLASLVTSTERKIDELDSVPTKKENNNGEMLQEA